MSSKFVIKPTAQLIRERGLQPYGAVQRFVDSEVIRYCDPMVPMATGTLKRSATTETVIGSGIVRYGTPYDRKNYYLNPGNGKQGLNRGGLRGRLWFERMKQKYKQVILQGAQKIAGKG